MLESNDNIGDKHRLYLPLTFELLWPIMIINPTTQISEREIDWWSMSNVPLKLQTLMKSLLWSLIETCVEWGEGFELLFASPPLTVRPINYCYELPIIVIITIFTKITAEIIVITDVKVINVTNDIDIGIENCTNIWICSIICLVFTL